MSFTRVLLIYSCISLFIFCSCEDTHSKKNNPSVITNEEVVSKEKLDNQKDTLQAKGIQKNDSLLVSNEEPFKLTNKNMKDFLLQYGKENPETLVRITTTFGDIHIQLYKDSPIHRANFIYLVKQQYFEGTDQRP